MAHNYRVGDRIRITDDLYDGRFGEEGTVVDVEHPEYTGAMPVLVEYDTGGQEWPQEKEFTVIERAYTALPQAQYIQAAVLALAPEVFLDVLNLARKIEEAAR